MSIFNAGMEKNQGGGIKKEDAIHIDIKVKGQVSNLKGIPFDE